MILSYTKYHRWKSSRGVCSEAQDVYTGLALRLLPCILTCRGGLQAFQCGLGIHPECGMAYTAHAGAVHQSLADRNPSCLLPQRGREGRCKALCRECAQVRHLHNSSLTSVRLAVAMVAISHAGPVIMSCFRWCIQVACAGSCMQAPSASLV